MSRETPLGPLLTMTEEQLLSYAHAAKNLNFNPPHRFQSMFDELLAQRARVAALEADCELGRMQMAACCTAALLNTRETAAQRIAASHPYYSAAYGDICRAVDREMDLRERVAALEQEKAQIAAVIFAERVDEPSGESSWVLPGDPDEIVCDSLSAAVAKTVELAEKEPSAALPAPTWQPIETVAPMTQEDLDGRQWIVFDGDVQFATRGLNGARQVGWFDWRGYQIFPTHVQSLPAPPAEAARS